MEDGADNASLYNQSELTKNPGAITLKLNKWDATFYSQETTDGESIIYFWCTGSKNDLFICSYTFDKPFLGLDWHNDEILIVSDILGSIKILD